MIWRRRRDDAQRGSGTGPRSIQGRRRSWGAGRAWRMDRQGPAQVALGGSADYARLPAGVGNASGVGSAPAPVTHRTNGRLSDLMPSVYCTACGEANPEGARFCSRCGTPLIRRSGERGGDTTSTISLGGGEFDSEQGDEFSADYAAVATLPTGTALLAVRRGPNAGSRFLLDSDLTLVGRHPGSDSFLDAVPVSGRQSGCYRH